MAEKLGNCQMSLDSADCALNAYCPLPNTKYNSWCKKCNEDMVPGFSCNCLNNLVLNCALCDNIDCIICIKGYILENGKCKAGLGTCDNSVNNCAHGTYCPPGNGQISCQPCENGPDNLECQCAGTLLVGCQECFYNKCGKCKPGLNLVYGVCLEQDDFGECIYLSDCQIGTGCKYIETRGFCRPCSEFQADDICVCKHNYIDGCNRCDEDGGCEQCAPLYGKKQLYGLGKCQYPGDCHLEDSSFNCAVGFQCNTEIGNVCEPCENNIYKDVSCNCRGDRKLYKCQECHKTDPAVCIKCVYGYTLELKSNGWWCRPNFCTSEDEECIDGFSCPDNPIGITQCEPCEVGARTSCTCYFQQNCETCNELIERCATCLPGFILKDSYCVAKTNICSQNGSYTCDNNFTCQGDIGSDCESCSNIKEYNSCNCFGELQKNCQKCNNTDCEICIKGYLLVNGTCESNMCGVQINTQNCQFGYYCANSADSDKEECLICDSQQQECNCGLLLGCQTCGTTPNTCDNCFFGYEKNDSNKCQLKTNICDFEQKSSLCNTGTYCSGSFGQPCESCNSIEKDQECKCGANLKKNCLQCNENDCLVCIDGYSSYLGNCIQNICISGGLSGTCVFGNYCPSGGSGNVSCQECPSPDGKPCQCGADNCLTCGTTSNTCGACLIGYQLNAANQCTLKSNICDSNSSSVLCSTGYYCKGTFGLDCSNCNMIQVGESCNCGGQYRENCIQCNNRNCSRCLFGYLLNDGKCIQNYCNSSLTQTNCAIGYYCQVDSKENDVCQQCIENSESICNCGTALKCTTCNEILLNTCKSCYRGHYLDISTQLCIEITDETQNICDAKDESTRCNDQYFCNSVFGQLCTICAQITPSKMCNCDGQLQDSCQLCKGKDCQICLTGYYLNQGKCLLNQCSNTIQCQDGFYCKPSSQPTSSCIPCTVVSITQCVCGAAKQCQTCSNLPGQCQTCLQGFDLQFGQCVVHEPCISQSDCDINFYCNAENSCKPCNNFQLQTCNCGNNDNCQMCANNICQSCIDGFQFDQNNKCTIPICNITIPPLSYCTGPNITNNCPPIIEDVQQMQSACNCGDSVNCGYCNIINQCDICMPGFILVNHQCYEQTPDFTGVCVTAPDSQFCQPNNSCILPPDCISCLGVSAGYTCNCDGNHVLNCTNCEGSNCTSCFTGFTLKDKVCIDACAETSQCQIGLFCQENGCIPCDGSSLCSCGPIIDCLNCNATGCLECRPNFELEDNKCDNCSINYEKVEGECIKIEDENDNKTFILNTIFMVIGVISVVGALVGIIVFYAKKPKRLSFQHKM